ncbi:MAG: DUF3786 domain-containing protein [Desulfobacterales bacterium]|nr:DUF3786 domain-containing protein [Desulfobacterales bacterium]MBS3754294.1 DUF3786 domain-containing protein [Desulfobacterales bacterium]
MNTEETVFGQTYRYYLSRIRELSLASLAQPLGAKATGEGLKIPFFGNEYTVSSQAMTDPAGRRPPHEICVILSKYILMCPDTLPGKADWVSFRDLKDAGPLTKYFANDVERAIAVYFSGNSAELKKAAISLGGHRPELDVDYDIALQFDALPQVPVLLLYNDADAEFSASCSVLFNSSVDTFLDAECIAMLGWQLFHHLKKANARQD